MVNLNRNAVSQARDKNGNLICDYCETPITKGQRSVMADGIRYHLDCARTLKKALEKLKNKGKIKPGQENQVKVIKEGGYY